MDPIYAIEAYFKTFDQTRNGFVPFHLFHKQKEVIYAYEKFQNNIITKPRQAGISTTTAAYIAVKAATADTESPESILIVANRQELAIEFLTKIKAFIAQMPRWVWGSEYYGTPEKEKRKIFHSDSKKELKLPNGTRLKAIATSTDALRGFTPTYLIMDEAAYIEGGQALYEAATPSLSTGGRCYLISTPNGQDPLYYETYNQASLGKNDFNIIEMRWYQDDRYNKDLKWIKYLDKEKKNKLVEEELDFTLDSYKKRIEDGWKPTSTWYETQCRKMNNNPRAIAQELDVSFLGSGGNVVESEYIEHHKTVNVREPKYKNGKEKDIWVWEEPIEGHEYIMAADVASGEKGLDYSTFEIIDVTTMEQVAEFMGYVPPDELAYLLDEYGSMYNALLVVDITGGLGEVTITKLMEIGYPNLYYEEQGAYRRRRKDEKKYNPDNERPGMKVGSSRPKIVSRFEEMVRLNATEGDSHGVKIRSQRLIVEMGTFIYKNGRPDHAPGKHDDLIMAMAMGLYALEYSFKKLQTLKNQNKAMLSSWIVTSGSEERDRVVRPNSDKAGKAPRKFMSNQDPTGEYSWLFAGFG